MHERAGVYVDMLALQDPFVNKYFESGVAKRGDAESRGEACLALVGLATLCIARISGRHACC